MAKISIIMGIYNCSKTLSEAIESILNQTYTDWQMIMCDDGSTDDTYKIACKYVANYGEKFVLLKNDRNMGLNYTLNRCLGQANGKYIARMDGDDISLPSRFEKEVNVLENEPDIAIVSTDMAYFDQTGVWGRIQHPEYPGQKYFMKESPFCHAPCMVRKVAFDMVKGYSESRWLLRVEDYNLWVKMYAEGYKGKNIHEVLYMMRDDRNAYSRRKFKYRINETYARVNAIKRLHLPPYYFAFCLRPIAVGILPKPLYDNMHKKRLSKNQENILKRKD